jgi:lipoate-protein ligase A
MTQLITLTAKAKQTELEGHKGRIVAAVKKLGGSDVSLDEVKKAVKKAIPEEKQVRFYIRTLRDEKLLNVKKEVAEKKAPAKAKKAVAKKAA